MTASPNEPFGKFFRHFIGDFTVRIFVMICPEVIIIVRFEFACWLVISFLPARWVAKMRRQNVYRDDIDSRFRDS